ncbi:MAG: methyltransferase domain-containing protein [Anaerolineae bacterium]|nr:methyltransferase domain-containing protein [Anaerolineae bacterium]MCO5187167.1 methyltransferase domain-containing protein [Anaerolineae bacterium]MCO5195979.1 methyltransferase domain-containing protein [Anaerolineae bacterium]MCO5199947.1 methyltransferase domain-containing protein [Anaerolineae bacterium]MCO5207409.1 methyltransferase domain-containing protein [Anaerolineae bacterium]
MTDLNRNTAVQTSRFYDSYWQAHPPQPSGEQENARLTAIQRGLDRFLALDHALILDLGCGRGWLAPYLAKYGDVVATDFSPDGLEYGRRNFGQFADFVLADPNLSNYGLGDRQFDVVICSEVIEHVEEALDLLKQIQKLLSSHGLCILTTPNQLLWSDFIASSQRTAHLQPIENWLSPSSLRAMAAHLGFVCLDHYGIPLHKIRFGRSRWLQNRKFQSAMRLLRLTQFYERILVNQTLYQCIVLAMPNA